MNIEYKASLETIYLFPAVNTHLTSNNYFSFRKMEMCAWGF